MKRTYQSMANDWIGLLLHAAEQIEFDEYSEILYFWGMHFTVV